MRSAVVLLACVLAVAMSGCSAKSARGTPSAARLAASSLVQKPKLPLVEQRQPGATRAGSAAPPPTASKRPSNQRSTMRKPDTSRAAEPLAREGVPTPTSAQAPPPQRSSTGASESPGSGPPTVVTTSSTRDHEPGWWSRAAGRTVAITLLLAGGALLLGRWLMHQRGLSS